MRRLCAVLLVLLSLAVLACGGAVQEATPSPRPTLRPTFTPAPTALPTPTPVPEPPYLAGELDVGSLSVPYDMANGRITMRVRISGTEADQAAATELEQLVELNAEAEALHLKLSCRGTLLRTGLDNEVYQIGDANYVFYDGEWRRVETLDEVEQLLAILEIHYVLQDTCGWRRRPDVAYEGLPVQHWTLVIEDLLRCRGAAQQTGRGDLIAATGSLLVVPEDHSVMQMDLVLEGSQLWTWLDSVSPLDEGRIEVAYDVSPSSQPLTITVPAEALAGKGPLDLEAIAALPQMTSFRASMQVRQSGTAAGQSVDGELGFLVEYTAEPRAQHLQVWVRKPGESAKLIAREVWQFPDSTYTRSGEQIVQGVTMEEIVAETDVASFHYLLEGTCGWKRQADTELNGVVAHHWTMEARDGLDCPDAPLLDNGDFSGFSGNLLIAAEGNYILHLELILEGTNLQDLVGDSETVLDEGRVMIAYDMSDVNQPFTLEAPRGDVVTPIPPVPELPAEPAQPAPDLLDQVMAASELVVSTDPNWAPQSFLNDRGELDGFDVDVAKEVARRLGVALQFVTPDWDMITGGNWGGRWDLSIGSMRPTELRAEALWFVDPYYYTPASFAVHKDNITIARPADLAGRKVGLGRATTYDSYLAGALSMLGGETLYGPPAGVQVIGYTTDAEAIQDLALGDGVRLDAVLSAQQTIQTAIDNGVPLKYVGTPAFYEPLVFALDKGRGESDKMLARLNEIIQAMHDDGTLAGLSLKWFGLDLTTVVKPGG
jgi:polar amino acid transport system substrate-binding protein